MCEELMQGDNLGQLCVVVGLAVRDACGASRQLSVRRSSSFLRPFAGSDGTLALAAAFDNVRVGFLWVVGFPAPVAAVPFALEVVVG